MQRYKEFDHTADIGVEIYGETLAKLFQNAGYALFDTMVDASAIQPALTRTVEITGNNPETLLMNWLRELLYASDVYQEVYNTFDVQTLVCPDGHDESGTAMLSAQIAGEPLHKARHRFRTEIKAVTYHQFKVSRQQQLWTARVVFDV